MSITRVLPGFVPDGPFLVIASRDHEYGTTGFRFMEHVRTAIALDRTYWGEQQLQYVQEDEHGYLQPDCRADISDHKVALMHFLSHADEMYTLLKHINDNGLDAAVSTQIQELIKTLDKKCSEPLTTERKTV